MFGNEELDGTILSSIKWLIVNEEAAYKRMASCTTIL
jgi:hypothetical protein